MDYGKPPKDVEFVRVNGNRVIRVEIARIGETPVVYEKDLVAGLMRTDGTPLDPDGTPGTRVAKVGDVQLDPDTQAAARRQVCANPGRQARWVRHRLLGIRPVAPAS